MQNACNNLNIPYRPQQGVHPVNGPRHRKRTFARALNRVIDQVFLNKVKQDGTVVATIGPVEGPQMAVAVPLHQGRFTQFEITHANVMSQRTSWTATHYGWATGIVPAAYNWVLNNA